LGEMLPEYYEIRGWNAEGEPTQEKLASLGLA
ncbi:MAG: tungsten-containing aldehyde ferredoxin oxidoreductase Aor, partial [Gemmatimonadota bacterium]|nr:tungsten-containing aldehyde ferredoxin oxidoreductase Aor [Gemmatimonadota bacterium]